MLFKLFHREQSQSSVQRVRRGTRSMPVRPTMEVLEDRLPPAALAGNSLGEPNPAANSLTSSTLALHANDASETNPGLPVAQAKTTAPQQILVAAPVLLNIPPAEVLRTPTPTASPLPLAANTHAGPLQTLTIPVLVPPSPYALVRVTSGGLTNAGTSLVLAGVPTQATVIEGQSLVFTAQAVFGDTPAQNPFFSLAEVRGESFPDGAVIDAQTGAFQWRPTAGTYVFRVRVQDGDYTAEQIVHLYVKPSLLQAAMSLPAVCWAGSDEVDDFPPALPDETVAVAFAAEAKNGELPRAHLAARICEESGSAFWLAVVLPTLAGAAAEASWRRAPVRATGQNYGHA
jgi:hypothetical protein